MMTARRLLSTVLAVTILAPCAFGAPFSVPAPESAIMVIGLRGPETVGPKLDAFAQATNLFMLAGVFNSEMVNSAITGSPEGVGIDVSGPMFFMAIMNPKEFDEPPVAFFPVTDFDAYINAIGGEALDGGIYKATIGLGSSYLARWGKYAVAASDEQCLAAALDDIAADRLMQGRMTPSELSLFESGDAVIYVAIDRVMELYAEEIDGFTSMMLAMASQAPGAPVEILKIEMELLLAAAEQMRGITAAVSLEPDGIMISSLASMRPGSKAEELLVRGGSALGLMEYVYVDNAMYQGAGTMGDPASAAVMRAVVEAIIELVDLSEEEAAEFVELTEEQLELFTGQVAFSLGMVEGENGLFVIDEIIEAPNAAAVRDYLNDVLVMTEKGLLKALMQKIGMAMTFTYIENADVYGGCAIDMLTANFEATSAVDEDGTGTTDQMFSTAMTDAFKLVYGEKAEVRLAFVDGLLVVSIGGDVDTRIRNLIDNIKSDTKSPAASEVYNAAIKHFPSPNSALMAIDMSNYLRFIGKMMATTSPQVSPVFAALAEMGPMPPLVFSTGTEKGAARMSMFVPNEAIGKMVGGFMQMMMMQQMAAPPAPGAMPQPVPRT